MEKLKKLRKYATLVLNRSKAKEESADFNFITDFKEEKCSIIWRIANIHRCTLKQGEFFESPEFSIMFCDEVKWTLKFYPRGRKTEKSKKPEAATVSELETAGLSINKISTNPTTSSFRFHFSYKTDLLHSKQFFFSPEKYINIEVDSTSSSEYGTDNLCYADELKHKQTLLVRCDFYATNVYNRGAIGMPGFFESCSLYQDLKEMYTSGILSDVTLQARDVQFPAHRAILASRSQVFGAMFKHDMKEAKNDAVEIEDIEPDVLSNMLQYIYTGNVKDFNVDKALALYPVAEKYFLDELKKWCTNVMLEDLTVENVCRIAVLADLFPDPRLKKATFNMFRNYTSDIFEREEWQDLIKDPNRSALVSNILQAVSADFTTNFP